MLGRKARENAFTLCVNIVRFEKQTEVESKRATNPSALSRIWSRAKPYVVCHLAGSFLNANQHSLSPSQRCRFPLPGHRREGMLWCRSFCHTCPCLAWTSGIYHNGHGLTIKSGKARVSSIMVARCSRLLIPSTHRQLHSLAILQVSQVLIFHQVSVVSLSSIRSLHQHHHHHTTGPVLLYSFIVAL